MYIQVCVQVPAALQHHSVGTAHTAELTLPLPRCAVSL